VKQITLKRRDNCRLCNSDNVVLAVEMEPIPPQELYLDSAEVANQVQRFPVDIYFCQSCGHVQQLDILDSTTLWQDYTYESSKAKGMMDHFLTFTDNVLRDYTPSKAQGYVLDIGSNDGALLSCFKQQGYQVLGVDPAENLAQQATAAGIMTLPELFNVITAEQIMETHGKAKIITSFNAFAHADDLLDIAKGIRLLLDDDGLFYFEVQYLLDVLDKVLIGTIFHEHMSHHSLVPMMQFLESQGMTVVDVVRVSVQHGALIGKVQIKGGPHSVHPRVAQMVALENKRKLQSLETIQNLGTQIERIRQQAQIFRQQVKRERAQVAAYGAARSGQSLISQLHLQGVIEFIVDNHPQKIGKYPAGDGIPVVATQELKTRKPKYTVILAWVHVKVIIENNMEYIQAGGVFVVLTPQLTCIDKDNVNSFLEEYGIDNHED
jgi:SAM-dependent methyltransferase